jgi:Arm DNA-binding domain
VDRSASPHSAASSPASTRGEPFRTPFFFAPIPARVAAHGAVAQLGERCVRNAQVRGSIPLGSTNRPVRDGLKEASKPENTWLLALFLVRAMLGLDIDIRGQHRGNRARSRSSCPQMPLTDTAIKRFRSGPKTSRLFDGGGLMSRSRPSGGKWRRLKYRFGGKEKRLSLGVYPDVGLRLARIDATKRGTFGPMAWIRVNSARPSGRRSTWTGPNGTSQRTG